MSKNVVTFEVNMAIKGLSKNKIKEIRSLSTKKGRDKNGLFLVEGDKCVRDTINFFDLENLICTEKWASENPLLTNNLENSLLITDKKVIDQISSLTSLPDVIAVYRQRESSKTVPLLESDKLYILLDEIQDPGNLGTIIRTCDWFGVYNIFASENTVDIYNPKVVQSTMGSLSRVKVHYLDLIELIEKNKNIKLIGTLLEGVPIDNLGKQKGGMLLMGNEGRGISDGLKEKIDLALTIPPVNKEHHPDSLNVAIATAIILSKFR